jgi:peptidoglycan-associated lipoprotein
MQFNLKKKSNLLSLFLVAFLLLPACSKRNQGKNNGVPNSLASDSSISGLGEVNEGELYTDSQSRFGEGAIPVAEEEGAFKDVYFDFDSSTIPLEGRQDLESNANLLQSNPNIKVVIEGHTDNRGTDEYNLALGEYRAKAVKEALMALGITSDRLSTVSYGENIAIDTSDTELGYAKNRRVHFAATGSTFTPNSSLNENAVPQNLPNQNMPNNQEGNSATPPNGTEAGGNTGSANPEYNPDINYQ